MDVDSYVIGGVIREERNFGRFKKLCTRKIVPKIVHRRFLEDKRMMAVCS